mgnify:CR=1 FL=1
MSKMQLGVIVRLGAVPEEALQKVADLELPTCQLAVWNESLATPEMAAKVKAAAEQTGVQISAVWMGWPGPKAWNFIDGPATLGLVPEAYRGMREQALIKGSRFAAELGVDLLVTHVGFIPENPSDPLYPGLVASLRYIVRECRANGQTFCFETGQETPTTLLRVFEDLGGENVGVNLDPANLAMYGKANPNDAAEVLGPWIRGVHAKDGLYPTDGRNLGKETPLGQGVVDFPRLIETLKKHDYAGAITIEREISGPQQIADIKAAVVYLSSLIN